MESGGSRRTRSQAAPDWTARETLTLVNEMKATEIESGNTLPSFQKWQLTVQNCNALDVNRSLNQCKQKWESIMESYKRLKTASSSFHEDFDPELFNAIEGYFEVVRDEDGGGVETDPDCDPEAQDNEINVFLETGSKRQRKRMVRPKHRMEKKLNSWRNILKENRKYEKSVMGINHEASKDVKWEAPSHEQSSMEIKHEPSSSAEKVELANHSRTENVESQQISVGYKDQTMAETLRRNAEMINAIVEGNLKDDRDYRYADFKNVEALHPELIRSQGDQLIDCLAKMSDTLSQLCDAIQECN